VETTAGPHPVTTARHGVCSCKYHKVITVFQTSNPRNIFFLYVFLYFSMLTETIKQCPQITILRKKSLQRKTVNGRIEKELHIEYFGGRYKLIKVYGIFSMCKLTCILC
jgi:hypothetical protein